MKLLLDTHVILWWVDDPMLIREDARLAIANARNSVLFSPMSFVEIAIKEAAGKLKPTDAVLDAVQASRFSELPLHVAHATELRALPLLHKDPFDRLLIAQARAEGLTLVSRDPQIQRYDVPCLAA